MSRPVAHLAVALALTLGAPLLPAASPLRQAAASDDYSGRWGLPGTPGGKRIGHLLEALSRDDAAFTRAFVESAFAPDFLAVAPLDAHVAQLSQIGRPLGTFEVVGIRRGEADATVALQGADGSVRRFQIGIEADAPHRITGIDAAGGSSGGAGGGDLAAPELRTLDDVGRFVDRLAEQDRFSGVVYVVRDGTPILEKAVGLANRETQEPNTIDTEFNVGSITKFCTRVALAKLMSEGRIDLDDPIGKHVEGLSPEIAERVTLRHLATFQSGLEEFFHLDEYANRDEPWLSLQDYVDALADEPLVFEPGTRTAYNNAGYILLGAVIESVTGRDYYTHIRELLFEPLGLDRSNFAPRATIPPGRAVGYTRHNGEWQPIGARATDRGLPAGGSYSSARDLYLFARALLGRQLLDERHTALAITDFSSTEIPTALGDAGGAPGVSALLAWDLARDLYLVVLANTDAPIAERLGAVLMKAPVLAATGSSGSGAAR